MYGDEAKHFRALRRPVDAQAARADRAAMQTSPLRGSRHAPTGRDRTLRPRPTEAQMRHPKSTIIPVSSFIIDAVRQLGAFGVAVLMLAENIFPPIPSEVIMPLAGYLASQGEMSFPLVVIGGTLGSLAGASFWFWVGVRIDRERLRVWIRNHGAFLAMTEDDLERAEKWFVRRGAASVFVGRLVPVVRTLISVPAGVAGMRVLRFGFYTLLGTGLWTAALAAGGWMLGQQFREIERYLGVVTWVVIAGLAVLYVVRIVHLKRSGEASFFGHESAP